MFLKYSFKIKNLWIVKNLLISLVYIDIFWAWWCSMLYTNQIMHSNACGICSWYLLVCKISHFWIFPSSQAFKLWLHLYPGGVFYYGTTRFYWCCDTCIIPWVFHSFLCRAVAFNSLMMNTYRSQTIIKRHSSQTFKQQKCLKAVFLIRDVLA